MDFPNGLMPIASDRYTGQPEPGLKDQLLILDAQQKMRERAIREQGYKEFQDLVSSGAKPEEALRRVAPKLYYNDPAHMATALKATASTALPQIPTQLNAVPALGPNGEAIANVIFDPAKGTIHSSYPNIPRLPPDVQLDIRESSAEIADLRKQLGAQRKVRAEAITDKDRSAAAGEIAQLEKALADAQGRRKSLYHPEQKSAPAADEKVMVMKDGKKFRLPKSQLKEAEAAGYQLVQ